MINRGTTGKLLFADCPNLCRLPRPGQSAKVIFADCLAAAGGKDWQSAKIVFADCLGSRQRLSLSTVDSRRIAAVSKSCGG
jgi:hypothetical protein